MHCDRAPYFVLAVWSHQFWSAASLIMTTIDAWKDSGFAAVAKSYLQWLPGETGLRRDIDESGDLVMRRMGSSERRELVAKLGEVAWFDPQTRGPRL